MSAGRIVVAEETNVTPELVEAFARLIPQLSSSSDPPDEAALTEVIRSEATVLLVARDTDAGNRIVGTLTLVVFSIPTGVRAIIEDVVVDEAVRGSGAADALSHEALRRARTAGAKTVDLTSRPSRVAANRFYQRLGFEQRETNVYRYTL